MTDQQQRLLDIFQFRHACKKFDPTKKVSDDEFHTLLEVARLSPSSFGLEPYKLIVLQNPDVRKAIYPYAWGAQKSLDGASHVIAFIALKEPEIHWNSSHVQHVVRDIRKLPEDVYQFYEKAYTNFGENDFKTFESQRSGFDWSCKQTYIALGNMLTAAAALRIDSCPIEGFIPQKLDEILGDSYGLYDTKRYGISVMAGFGYRAENPHRPKTRRPMEELVIWK